jgi:hypothetical protein
MISRTFRGRFTKRNVKYASGEAYTAATKLALGGTQAACETGRSVRKRYSPLTPSIWIVGKLDIGRYIIKIYLQISLAVA